MNKLDAVRKQAEYMKDRLGDLRFGTAILPVETARDLALFALAALDALEENPDAWITGPPGEVIKARITRNLENK